jgi:Protein kinase domain
MLQAHSECTPPQTAPLKNTLRLGADHYLATHVLLADFTDRYTLEADIGSGGYGFVCSALCKSNGLPVAVKFILRDKIRKWHGNDPLECYFLQRINHQHIIGFIEYLEDARYVYLVTELHGQPWNEKKDTQPLTPQTPGHLSRQLPSSIESKDPLPQPDISPSTINIIPIGSSTPQLRIHIPLMRRSSSCDLFEYAKTLIL